MENVRYADVAHRCANEDVRYDAQCVYFLGIEVLPLKKLFLKVWLRSRFTMLYWRSWSTSSGLNWWLLPSWYSPFLYPLPLCWPTVAFRINKLMPYWSMYTTWWSTGDNISRLTSIFLQYTTIYSRYSYHLFSKRRACSPNVILSLPTVYVAIALEASPW